MNYRQKDKVGQLREAGLSYAGIAQTLALSENTVKSYCQRNNLGGSLKVSPSNDEVSQAHCTNCGTLLNQMTGHRAKKFCSDRCRMAWWNKHPAALNRKNTRVFTCQACGMEFYAYGKRERKYCSRACFGKSKVRQS